MANYVQLFVHDLHSVISNDELFLQDWHSKASHDEIFPQYYIHSVLPVANELLA